MKIKAIQISAETKEAQKQLEEINLTLDQQEDLVKDIQREIEKLEDKRDATSKKDLNRLKQYNKKIEDAQKAQKRLNTRIKGTRKDRGEANIVFKHTIKEQRNYGGVLGTIDKQLGGAISGFSGMIKSLTGVTKGFNLMKIAIIGTGIGALVIGVIALIQSFKRSEAGQEKLQRGMAMIGAVVNQVLDLFGKLGESIISAVTNPMKAIKSLGSSITKFISNPFKTIKEAVVGAAESVKGFVEETKKEVGVLDEVTKKRQKAHHIERDLQIERAKANNEINDIRLQAEDRENKTSAQRIVLLRKAQKIEEDITKKEIEAKQLLVDAQILEMEQGDNNIASKDKLAKMQAELINLDTKKLRSQRLLQTQITTAVNEEKAIKEKAKTEANKKIEDDKIAAEKVIEDAKVIEQKRLDAIKAIQTAFEEQEAEAAAITEEDKAILESEKAIAELDKLNATEEQKAKIIAFWNGEIQKGKDKDSALEKVRDKSVSQAKLDIAKQSMALIGEIAGKGSAIGKAMAIGQATISGIEGVQNAFTTANKNPITIGFPAYPYIQAGLAGVFSALQIKKIASTKADGKGASPSPTVSSGGGGGGATPSVPPEFNTVGASDTNQLADAIGSQSQQPVQAFVVSNDVTTAQGLERNIIDGATI